MGVRLEERLTDMVATLAEPVKSVSLLRGTVAAVCGLSYGYHVLAASKGRVRTEQTLICGEYAPF